MSSLRKGICQSKCDKGGTSVGSRSSCTQVFYRIAVMKNLMKFTGKVALESYLL